MIILMSIIKREKMKTAKTIQRKQNHAAPYASAGTSGVSVQAPQNRTGLPDTLKSGIESLSGLAMDDVRVHYNSPKPVQFQALAYAKGTDIHIAPGQERHLPHEAWHVVQQKQGRVKANLQMAGAAVNDDEKLENEADDMGVKALTASPGIGHDAHLISNVVQAKATSENVVQRSSVEIEEVESDHPTTVVSKIKDAGIDKVYLGVSTKATYAYERPKLIKAVIHPGNGPDDTTEAGNDLVGTTAEIGGLGNAEAWTLGYPGDVNYAGGHLIGAQFWQNANTSLLEENLVPMRQSINSSIYKIMEHEVATHVGGNNKIGLDISLHYDPTTNVTLNQGQLQAILQQRFVNTAGFDFTQSFNLRPRVPDKITVKVSSFTGEPDLPKRTLNNPVSGDIQKSATFSKPVFVSNIGWNATSSKLKPPFTQAYWNTFNPVKLKQTGVRTYNFFQETL
jgi:hypothetical protein